MAIRVRRGLLDDLDKSKLLPGEWAVSIDPESGRQQVFMCFSPGITKRMGTYDDFQSMIEEISEDILDKYKAELLVIRQAVENLANTVSADKAEVIQIKANITNVILPEIEQYVLQAKDYANNAEESKQNASVFANKAAESAEVSGQFAELSKSYAVGGTGKREGEDTDNAKFYADKALQSANKAADDVKNELKDYSDSAQMSAAEAKQYRDEAQAIVGIDVMVGATEDADGKSGLVPIPHAGDNNKFFSGDGTFKEVNVEEKANGKGISFYIDENNRPHIVFKNNSDIVYENGAPVKLITDEQIDEILQRIDSNQSETQQDNLIDQMIANTYDNDISNDAKPDQLIDEMIDRLYS